MQSLFTSEGQNPTRVCRIYNNRFILHLLIPVHFKVISTVESCEEKVFLFDQIINTGLDLLVPIRPRKIHPTEPPWISSTLKEMIQRRQRALYNDTIDDFRCLRNKVNRERKQCRAKYFKTKVEHLEHCKPSAWWSQFEKLTGSTPSSTARTDITKSLQHVPGPTDTTSLANSINESFLTPMQGFSPLPYGYSRNLLSENTDYLPLEVTRESVFLKLSKLNESKAHGTHNIPLSLVTKRKRRHPGRTITQIINTSFREGRLPSSWKRADVVPVPKQKPVEDINKHLRPISLTPIISKIAEEYIVNAYMKPAVLEQIDPQQFGTIPRSSTTQALISMIHYWSESTDGNGSTTRVMLFYFRKAFDLINHHGLLHNMMSHNIPRHALAWITDFVTDRKQRVKINNDCFSKWGLRSVHGFSLFARQPSNNLNCLLQINKT